MRARGVQVSLAVVGADQEAARSAGRIEDRVAGVADAEAVDQVHRVVAGEMLAVAVPLVRADELLEDASHHVGRHFAEVDRFDAAQQTRARRPGRWRGWKTSSVAQSFASGISSGS